MISPSFLVFWLRGIRRARAATKGWAVSVAAFGSIFGLEKITSSAI